MTNKRMLYLTLIIATLAIGVVIGTIVSGGVKATGEQQRAQTLAIPDPVSLSNVFSQIAANLDPAVVNINTEATVENPLRGRNNNPNNRNPNREPLDPFDFFNFLPDLQDRDQTVRNLGTGFIVDRAGYILTNHHVVDKATKIKVRLDDKSEFTAKVIGTDSDTDLAVIKIDAGHDLPFAKLGNSDAVKVGDWVLAIGSPFSLEHTVTAGIISAKRRDNIGGSSTGFQSFLQTDAAINPGNSGGPLVSMSGEVIGINTAIVSDTRQSAGLGFALPSNTAVKVYNQLVQSGKVTRGGIGIGLPGEERNAKLCRSLGLKSECGVVVNTVTPGLPAAKAGIRDLDVITEIDGTKITSESVLLDAIANNAVGKTIQVKINRDGREMTLPVTIVDRNEVLQAAGAGSAPNRNDPGDAGPARLGIRVGNITPNIGRQLRLQSQEGVYVSSVEAGSVAEEAGLVRGAIITQIIVGKQRYEIMGVDDFEHAERNLKSGQEVAFRVFTPDRNTGEYRWSWVPLMIP